MQYINISPGLSFSRIVAGVMYWGQWGKDYKPKEVLGLIEHSLEHGISTFDHADIYGHYTTETLFGDALRLQPALRAKMQLVSKCGIKLVTPNRPQYQQHAYDTSKTHIIASAEQSLRNLGTDYLDLLLIHRPDPLLNPSEVAEAVAYLKKEGKIRAFGVSNFSPSQLEVLRQATPIATNQVEISVAARSAFLDGTLDQCLNLGIPTMAWSPLGGGSVFAKDADEQTANLQALLKELGPRYQDAGPDIILLAWLMRHPTQIIPVLGTGRKERLSAAVQALDIEIGREDWFRIWEAAGGEIP